MNFIARPEWCNECKSMHPKSIDGICPVVKENKRKRGILTIDLEFNKLPITVEYQFHPKEPAIRYDTNLTGYPGSLPYVTIYEVYHSGYEITDFIEEMDLSSEIEQLILKQYDGDN